MASKFLFLWASQRILLIGPAGHWHLIHRPRARWEVSYFAERIAERVIVGDVQAPILFGAPEKFRNEFVRVSAVVVVEGGHVRIGPAVKREANKSAAEAVKVLFIKSLCALLRVRQILNQPVRPNARCPRRDATIVIHPKSTRTTVRPVCCAPRALSVNLVKIVF